MTSILTPLGMLIVCSLAAAAASLALGALVAARRARRRTARRALPTLRTTVADALRDEPFAELKARLAAAAGSAAHHG